MIKLGVNIDHVATIRQARRTNEPDPIWAAAAAQLGGADGITVHLREDRRHIQDRDLRLLLETVTVKLNLECSCSPSMVKIAVESKPQQVCLVPENRQEITTEGGLDLASNFDAVACAMEQLQQAGIRVSLFLDPDHAAIESAVKLGADRVELHTGSYANTDGEERENQLKRLTAAAEQVATTTMTLDAGHGLTYHNVVPISQLPGLDELNIGHSIVARSTLVGMQAAVAEMKQLINRYPGFGETS